MNDISNVKIHPDKTKIAMKRWNMLKEVIVSKKNVISENEVSVRRFKSYGLLQTEIVPQTKGSEPADANSSEDAEWVLYTTEIFPELKMFIRHLSGHITPETLLGFNNTGNVCVWPAEEVLTFYCLCNSEIFSKKSVIELGGGMTCLAGVALSLMSAASHVMLTDGNEESVANLNKIIQRNASATERTMLSCRRLRWGFDKLENDMEDKYHFVICADCLFFEEGREDLVRTIFSLLKTNGLAIVFAPKRGETFNEFVALAENYFSTEVIENYDERVWGIHNKMKEKGIQCYDENIHYPLLLLLRKSSQ